MAVTTELLHATCPTYGAEAATHFLEYWFRGCEGLAELRFKIRDRMVQEFFSIDRLENMARRSIALSSEGCEVYFGVSTRLERKGRKESVASVPGFFCDLDFSPFEVGGIDALERLDGFTPHPTQVIHTGGGLHVYWRITTPLLPTPKTQAMLRAVVREVGADPAATDLSRVLRVPGTWSWKRDAPVRIVRCDCGS